MQIDISPDIMQSLGLYSQWTLHKQDLNRSRNSPSTNYRKVDFEGEILICQLLLQSAELRHGMATCSVLPMNGPILPDEEAVLSVKTSLHLLPVKSQE